MKTTDFTKYPKAFRLNNNWRAFSTDFSSSILYLHSNEPLSAPLTLPMDVRSLLHKEGKCADPRIGMQSLESDWSMSKEWWFTTHFSLTALAPSQRAFLRIKGVDYIAEYFINGKHIGSSKSFNQECFFDISDYLQNLQQEHELSIRLWGALPHEIVTDPESGHLSVTRDITSLKANLLYGGDHNACTLTCGIAEAPQIIIADAALVQSIMPDYQYDAGYAHVTGKIVAKGKIWKDTPFTATITPRNFEGTSHEIFGVWKCGNEMAIALENLSVMPWQPYAFGTPHCYTLTIQAGNLTSTYNIGFRSFERRKNDAFVQSPLPSIMDWHPYENSRRYGSDIYKGFDAISEVYAYGAVAI